MKLLTYSSKINNNHFLNTLNEENNKLNNINNNKNNNLEDSSKLFCFPNSNKKEMNTSKKSFNSFGLNIKKNTNNNINNSINSNRNKIIGFDDIEKIEFPLSYYLLGFFLIKIKSRKFKNSCISEKFSRSFKFFTHIVDISSYISLYKQFELFKKIVEKRLNLNEENNKKDEKIIKNNRLSNYDKYLYNHITSNKKMKSITIINRK